jgi:hypothetical protein
MKQNVYALTVMMLALAGCDVFQAGQPAKAPVAAVPVSASPLGVGKTAAALDSTTAAEKAAALAAPKGGAHKIGSAVVALGNPAEQGFWLKSALIVVPGKGHVVTEDGGSIAVDLLPGDGAAQLSLAAFRALGLGLTDLPEVTIFSD